MKTGTAERQSGRDAVPLSFIFALIFVGLFLLSPGVEFVLLQSSLMCTVTWFKLGYDCQELGDFSPPETGQQCSPCLRSQLSLLFFSAGQ